ncbi:MAG TPA: hypothetical protein V6C64_13100 [Microcoleaceae cyanobacterium]|jgi:hypothetical protein
MPFRPLSYFQPLTGQSRSKLHPAFQLQSVGLVRLGWIQQIIERYQRCSVSTFSGLSFIWVRSPQPQSFQPHHLQVVQPFLLLQSITFNLSFSFLFNRTVFPTSDRTQKTQNLAQKVFGVFNQRAVIQRFMPQVLSFRQESFPSLPLAPSARPVTLAAQSSRIATVRSNKFPFAEPRSSTRLQQRLPERSLYRPNATSAPRIHPSHNSATAPLLQDIGSPQLISPQSYPARLAGTANLDWADGEMAITLSLRTLSLPLTQRRFRSTSPQFLSRQFRQPTIARNPSQFPLIGSSAIREELPPVSLPPITVRRTAAGQRSTPTSANLGEIPQFSYSRPEAPIRQAIDTLRTKLTNLENRSDPSSHSPGEAGLSPNGSGLPPTEVNRIADQVYSTIERKLRIEQERRGR